MINFQNDVNIYSHYVTKHDQLYHYLKKELILSLRQTKEFMKDKRLLLNDGIVKKDVKVKPGDCIALYFKDEVHHYQPFNYTLEILYESDDLLIINKPPHMVVYDQKDDSNQTLANAIAFYFEQIGLKRKIRFVNRLDQDTSGLIIVAKNPYAHQFIAKQFESNDTIKTYVALTSGYFEREHVIINEPIERIEGKYRVSKSGKPSLTEFYLINHYDEYALVKCILKSGRTHQIRVHLSHLQTPILGDTLYHQTTNLISRQALHAHQYTFIEPRTHQTIQIDAPIPMDMQKLITKKGTR